MKSIYKFWFGIVIILSLFLLLWQVKKELVTDSMVNISLVFQNESDSAIQMFYSSGKAFNAQESQVIQYQGSENFQKVTFQLSKDDDLVNLRFDLGGIGGEFLIKEVLFSDSIISTSISAKDLIGRLTERSFIEDITYDSSGNFARVMTISGDPYLSIFNVTEEYHPFTENYRKGNPILMICNFLLLGVLYFWIRLRGNIFDMKLRFGFRGLFVFIFIAILISPFVLSELQVFKTNKNMENRFLAEYPTIGEFGYKGIFHAYSVYFEDNFGLRAQMITAINFLHFTYLDEAATINKVEIGDDSWLFASDYLRSNYFFLLSQAELAAMKTNLTQRGEYLNNLGIKYYLLIPPTKASVYPEKNPKFYKKFLGLPNIQLVINLFENEDNVRTTPLSTALQQTKEASTVPIYYKFDSHWNSVGAKVGYDLLLETIKKDFPNVYAYPSESYDITFDSTYEGDLARSMAIGDLLPRSEVVYSLKGETKQEGGASQPFGHITVFRDKVTGDSLKVLMFHDSFGVALMPFLSQTFTQMTFLWTTDFRFDVIEQEKPDIVIQERMQIYLREFVQPNTPEFMERLEWSRTLNDSIPE